MRIRTLVALVALVSSAAGSAFASSCPVLTASQLACQKGVAKAGAKYSKTALKTIEKCLQAIQSGKLTGNPATVCLGTSPSDASTATKMTKAAQKVGEAVPKACNDTDAAAFQDANLGTGAACAPTAAGLATCLVSNMLGHVTSAAGAAYGTVVASADKGVQKCQKILGKESAKFVKTKLKAVQRCLDTRNEACGSASPVVRCLAPQAGGPAAETALLSTVATAETKLRAKIAKACTDTQVAALDACGNDVAGVSNCLVCAHGNAADLLAADQNGSVHAVTPASTAAAAANAANAEDTILLEPGSYVEEVTLKDSGLTVKGVKDCVSGARAVFTPPNASSLYGVQHCGSLVPSCTDISDNVLLQGFEVNDYLENDIYNVGVDGITYRDMVTRGPGVNGRARYGVFPVGSHDVLVEDCLVTGISDAGIYVGQSDGIIVRNNEVHDSVAGIEIENSANAEVYGNYAHDNAGGILVFKLPFYLNQTSNCHDIHDNRALNNNGPNYGSGTVGLVPPGTGMLILSNDSGIFQNNTVTGNKTIGVSVVDQQILNLLFDPDPFDTLSANQDVNDNAFVGNTITGNGFDPDSAVAAFAADVVFAPLAASGNCQNGNTYNTDVGNAFTNLPACPGAVSPRPGCPFVATTTTTTTTSASSTTTSTTLPWTFAAQVQPLLATNCAGCHGGPATAQYAGLKDLDDPALAYAHIVNVVSTELPTMDRIEPGNHALSYLWNKINGTQLDVGGAGVRMPQFGPYLSQSDIDGIAGWIDAGALNN